MKSTIIGCSNLIYITSGKRKAQLYFDQLSEFVQQVSIIFIDNYSVTLMHRSSKGAYLCKSFSIPLPKPKSPGTQSLQRWFMLASTFTALFLLLLYARFTIIKGQVDIVIFEGLQILFATPFIRTILYAKKTIYYILDYFPNKCDSNSLYQVLNSGIHRFTDLQIIDNANAIWAMTQRIADAYIVEKIGSQNGFKKPIVVQPLYRKPITRPDVILPVVAYVGTVRSDVGIDLAINAIADLKSQHEYLELEVMGTKLFEGSAGKELAQLSVRLGVKANFRGIVSDDEMTRILSTATCGLALFNGGKSNYSYYGVPGKVREYLEHSLPVVITRDFVLAEEIAKAGAGIQVENDVKELEAAFHQIRSNIKLYIENMRKFTELLSETNKMNLQIQIERVVSSN